MSNTSPQIGEGATLIVGSDRYPYTVVAIEGPKRILVQQDEYYGVKGHDNSYTEDQRYVYLPNKNAPVKRFTLRKNGAWVELGYGLREGSPLVVGVRRAYMDPSF